MLFRSIPRHRDSYECGVKGTHFEPTNECELEELIYQFEATAQLWNTDTELSTLKYTGQLVMNLRRCAIKISRTDYQEILNYFVNTIGCLIVAYMYAKFRMDAISPAQVALATCLPIEVQNGLYEFYNFIQQRRYNNQRVTTDIDILMEQFMRLNIDGTKDTPLDLSWDAIKFNNQCAILYKFPTNFAVDKTHLYIPNNEEKDFIFAPIVCIFPNIKYHLGFGYKGETIINEEATAVIYRQETPNYWAIDKVDTIHIDNHTITQTEENLSQHNFRTNFYALGANETEAVTQQKPEWELETKYAHCEFENPYKVYQQLNHHLVSKSIACNNLKANPDTIPMQLGREEEDIIEVIDKLNLNNGATVTDDKIVNSTDVVNKDYVDKLLTEGVSLFQKTTYEANYESVVVLLLKYDLNENLYENLIDGRITITKNGSLSIPYLTSFDVALLSGYSEKRCYYKINYNDRNGYMVTCTYEGEKYIAWNMTPNAQWGEINFIGKFDLKEMEQDYFLKPVSYLRQQPDTEDVILNEEVYNSIVEEPSIPDEMQSIKMKGDLDMNYYKILNLNEIYCQNPFKDYNLNITSGSTTLGINLNQDNITLAPYYQSGNKEGITMQNNNVIIRNLDVANSIITNVNEIKLGTDFLNLWSENRNTRLKYELMDDYIAIAPVYQDGFKEGIRMQDNNVYIRKLIPDNIVCNDLAIFKNSIDMQQTNITKAAEIFCSTLSCNNVICSGYIQRNIKVDGNIEHIFLNNYTVPCYTDLENPKFYRIHGDRKSTRLNSSHSSVSRMPSSA